MNDKSSLRPEKVFYKFQHQRNIFLPVEADDFLDPGDNAEFIFQDQDVPL